MASSDDVPNEIIELLVPSAEDGQVVASVAGADQPSIHWPPSTLMVWPVT
jgi:hypothetical protein